MTVVPVLHGEEFNAKHTRAARGRFGPGMSRPKLLKRDERAVVAIGATFHSHPVPTRQHAAEYTRGQRRRIRPETVDGFHELAGKLRRRDTSDERVKRLDEAMTPTTHDLVLTRHIPASAFGLKGDEDLARLPEMLTGRKIIDRAYTPTALHQDDQSGGITVHIAAPAGTRALVAGDNEIWLDRDLELAVGGVYPNGRGGYTVEVTALPKTAPATKAAAKKAAKKVPAPRQAGHAPEGLPPDAAKTKTDRIAEFDRRTEAALVGHASHTATPYTKGREDQDSKVGDHTSGQVDRALGYYAGLGYMAINDSLRTGHRLDEEMRDIDAIDAAMAHSHLTHDIVVTRGIRRPDQVFGDAWNDHDVTGLEWTDKGYSSTSTTQSAGRSFFTDHGGVGMRILVPKGAPAVSRSTDAEGEIILGRGARFRVVRDNGVVDGIRQLDVEVVVDGRAGTRAASRTDDVEPQRGRHTAGGGDGVAVRGSERDRTAAGAGTAAGSDRIASAGRGARKATPVKKAARKAAPAKATKAAAPTKTAAKKTTGTAARKTTGTAARKTTGTAAKKATAAKKTTPAKTAAPAAATPHYPSRSAPKLSDLIFQPNDPHAAEQVKKAIEGTYGGLDVHIDKVGHTTRTELDVTGQILNPRTGVQVGRFAREFRRQGGEYVAVHEFLQLNPDVQGSGFAREFNANLFDWYRRSGFDRVEVHANIDVGGYTWATQGFDFESDEALAEWLSSARGRLDRYRGVIPPQTFGGVAVANPRDQLVDAYKGRPVAEIDAELQQMDDLLREAENGRPVSAYEISQLGRQPGMGRDDMWIGKAMMLGSHWMGALRL